MENYFNYFTEIEERYLRRRGGGLLLSTLDWALIETWKDAGIPLEAVLRGIDEAFDKYDQRPSKTKNAGTSVRPATPEQMNGILSELMRVGQFLRAAQHEPDSTVQQELGIYRKHVEQLRSLLPSIHATLLHERARLEQERQRLNSASEWVRASRQTL